MHPRLEPEPQASTVVATAPMAVHSHPRTSAALRHLPHYSVCMYAHYQQTPLSVRSRRLTADALQPANVCTPSSIVTGRHGKSITTTLTLPSPLSLSPNPAGLPLSFRPRTDAKTIRRRARIGHRPPWDPVGACHLISLFCLYPAGNLEGRLAPFLETAQRPWQLCSIVCYASHSLSSASAE